MKDRRNVRPQVLGVPRRGDELLVEYYDEADEQFYRPLGGGIEFGEPSDEAVVREFAEELDAVVAAGEVLGTMENRFRWADEPFHQLVVVRAVSFRDGTRYERERFTVTESDGSRRPATWERLDSFGDGKRLLPAGIERLLRGEETHVLSPPRCSESRSG
ncbi:NUDIX domain-containing protein [Halosegnis marinus]|uniref:NUDIX domain-containing protein n=1 Tax=Halosegnis marinus TaxID=3034023 RepID=A0ABD5ZR58_9EURY